MFKESFLALVRLEIGHSVGMISNNIDWSEIEALASLQGLSAVIVDAVEKLRPEQRPPQEILLQWIGDVLQDYEYRYDAYKHTIAEMAAFYNSHGYKMMLLKGYACSLNWPKPEHRPCGDIDIWQFGQYRKADELVAKEKRIKIDDSHQHHTVFNWGEFTVENHYDFNNVYHHKSSAELEKIFKELGDLSHTDSTDIIESAGTRISAVEVCGEKVYLPSPNLHALFLLKHTMTDFAAFYVTLRQFLDWAFFVEKHGEEVDWKWLDSVIEQYHMKDFFNCINAICVEDLGFDACLFNGVQFNPALKEKVLADILDPKSPRKEPKCLIPRLVFKYRRWKGNAWRHELCYKESLMSGFWSGMKTLLLKPASI